MSLSNPDTISLSLSPVPAESTHIIVQPLQPRQHNISQTQIPSIFRLGRAGFVSWERVEFVTVEVNWLGSIVSGQTKTTLLVSLIISSQ